MLSNHHHNHPLILRASQLALMIVLGGYLMALIKPPSLMRLYDLQSSIFFFAMTVMMTELRSRRSLERRIPLMIADFGWKWELCANGLIWFGNGMSQFRVTSLCADAMVRPYRRRRDSVGGMITSFFGQIVAPCTLLVRCCVLQIGHLLADRRAWIHLFRRGGDKHKALIMFTCSERQGDTVHR